MLLSNPSIYYYSPVPWIYFFSVACIFFEVAVYFNFQLFHSSDTATEGVMDGVCGLFSTAEVRPTSRMTSGMTSVTSTKSDRS